jgi:hypothetical protein
MAETPKELGRIVPEFSDQRALERFKKAAAEYTRNATTSRKKARNTLVRLGIITKSGKISTKYR